MTDTTAPPPEDPPEGSEVLDQPLSQLLSDKYLAYAMSTIMARSLPDVRDGLKPVHRRLLFAMRNLNLAPANMPRKSARVVGDVIGRYHPHGDTAVYDAMVRLAQDFAVRYPLVEGQGNFGNIDGDNAAAMRYTEAKLTPVAEALLAGIDEDAVDFRETYDGDGSEPVVLPAAFPNLLANGATGIAVGMATSIPPHNVGEVCDALRHLIANRDADTAALMEFIKGPDFPTGGVLVESRAAMVEAYALGRGGFRVRARWHREELKQGQYQVIVTEIPYQVQKAKLKERIEDLLQQRKLPLVEDVRDESAEDVRLVLVPKSRNVDPALLMESLFKVTDLEARISLNMNVLDQGVVPKVMALPEVLQAFLNHRHEVLIRRSRYRLGKIERRLEILDGYLIAYLNIDEVIQIIRESDEPKQQLIERFELSELQAESVLNMRLRALRKLEEIEIRKEHQNLAEERADLTDLLAKEARRWQAIDGEIVEIASKFGGDTAIGKRRTEVGAAPAELDMPTEALVEREPVTVLLSEKGWVRALRGHVEDTAEVKHKEGDAARFALKAWTTDKLLVFSTKGRCYTVSVDRLPGGRGFGEPLRLMVDFEQDADIAALAVYAADARLLLASSQGRGFVVAATDCMAQTRNGKQVMNVPDGGALARALPIPPEHDHVAIAGTNHKLLVFPLEEVPPMTRGRGVILQKYKDARLFWLQSFRFADGLRWSSGNRTRTEADLTAWLGHRAQVGRQPPHGFPKPR